MLRQKLTDTMKESMKAGDKATLGAVRLILSTLKDRDIAARSRGVMNGITDEEAFEMMQKMVKQRQESIELYRQGQRQDLVDKEQSEIAVIERFLPTSLSEAESLSAIEALLAELGASSIKDMGRVMAALKERFAGRMDFTKASALVKGKLG